MTDTKRCLNGRWQFQPVQPGDEKDTLGVPVLTPCDPNGWSDTPLIVPSPWNGNEWGGGGYKGKDYWHGGVYYPTYPEEWAGAKMGWLRKRFDVADPTDRRWELQFDAIAGEAVVLVNGVELIRHFDSYLPFGVDITDVVKAGENEVLVGVRSHRLFDKQSKRYCKMRCPYPTGSNTDGLCGIWQDVWLVSTPKIYIRDVFVKPFVSKNRLVAEITVVNTTDSDATLPMTAKVANALRMEATLSIKAGEVATVTLETNVDGALDLWSMDTPVLYTLEVCLSDEHCFPVRFGWREFLLDGNNITLNGDIVRLVGDICHPFGPYMFREEWIRCWYRLIKDLGGNAVRLHAQIYPPVFLDIADEMGLAVLDETGLFGSNLSANLEEEAAWERFNSHMDGLVLRDRNHASVFGWSVGNELFAFFLYDEAAKQDADIFYEKLITYAKRPAALDDTRPFITCDGDEDLKGTLPIWSKHFGHGLHPLPDTDKPVVIGENGGSYYARPSQLAPFAGEAVYESYTGRNRALGVDLYQNIRHLKEHLCYFSPSEVVWFGLEPLPYGYNDFSRFPTREDGIFFEEPAEGTPGIWHGRIPPFSGTLNPGWDKSLPEYVSLGMAEGMKDGLTNEDKDAHWQSTPTAYPAPPSDKRISVGFMGDKNHILAQITGGSGFDLVMDLATANPDTAQKLWQEYPGKILAVVGDELPAWLAEDIALTDRAATQLTRSSDHPYVASLTAEERYAAENPPDERLFCRHGLAITGDWEPLLEAGNIDWSLFLEAPERVKCGAVFLYEKMQKPAGVVLAKKDTPAGERLMTTLLPGRDEKHVTLWRRLFHNMGWNSNVPQEVTGMEDTEHDLLMDGPVD